jgi:hypothetical protein
MAFYKLLLLINHRKMLKKGNRASDNLYEEIVLFPFLYQDVFTI